MVLFLDTWTEGRDEYDIQGYEQEKRRVSEMQYDYG